MRLIVASILCVATAFRTNIATHNVQKRERTNSKFGATCESLHDSFSERLTAVQEQVDQMDTAGGHLSRGCRARLTMRMYGIGRTLRRAKDCQWVQDTDSENMERVRILVETLMESNPCADAARAQLATASTAETEEERAQAMQMAMSILSSDTCTATEITVEGAPEEEVDDAQMGQSEEQALEGVEEMVEASEGGSSFVETDEKYAIERFLRFLVVLAIYLFLVVVCTWVVVWVGLFIIQYFTMLLGMLGIWVTGILWEQLIMPPALLACGYDLFYRILNPEIHALNR